MLCIWHIFAWASREGYKLVPTSPATVTHIISIWVSSEKNLTIWSSATNLNESSAKWFKVYVNTKSFTWAPIERCFFNKNWQIDVFPTSHKVFKYNQWNPSKNSNRLANNPLKGLREPRPVHGVALEQSCTLVQDGAGVLSGLFFWRGGGLTSTCNSDPQVFVGKSKSYCLKKNKN